MVCVIIAGGSGTRLWPLSTHDYPKHLLALTNSKSLLQNTYQRVAKISEKVLIIPEASHAEHVYEQLPDLERENILVEPGRRGTASCVILALSEIRKRHWDDQAVLFLWADHLIRDNEAFCAAAEQAAELAESAQKLVFMGIEPTYPSTGFGYMQKGARLSNGHKNVFELQKFVEKPDRNTAEKYFQTGQYLWNMGYLAGTLETFERDMQAVAPDLWQRYNQLLNSEDTAKTYLDLPPEAIDTALSEKVDDALVVPGTFDWVDVGSFTDLHMVSAQDDHGNHVRGETVMLEHVSNSYIRNETDLPVAVIGLDNVAVVVNENGILITNQTHAQKVGDIAKRIQS